MAKKVVKATCVLHNFLQRHTYNSDNNEEMSFTDGDEQSCCCLRDIASIGNRGSYEAINVRDEYKSLFVYSSPVPRQLAHVRQGNF